MMKTDFIAKVAALTKADTRVLPSLTIAQAILESAWGESGLTEKANALFGIKATKSWKGKCYSAKTKECYDGVNMVDEVAAFRAYDSWADSVADHTAFLCKYSRYKPVLAAKDYKTACKAIQAAGYATDPAYASKLIALIEKYNLNQYDEKPKASAPEKEETAAPASGKTHFVVRGDTLGKLAVKYKTSVQALVNANKAKYPKITANHIQIGWELNVGKTSGTTPYKVKTGDSLWKIAEKKLGDGNRYKEIMLASGITSTKIFAGQTLQIPN
jgi:LysM repeat protein